MRDVRNDVMHNADFTFTTAEMKTHLHSMIDLLQEPKLHEQRHTETAANYAIDEIKQVRFGRLIVPCAFLTDWLNY